MDKIKPLLYLTIFSTKKKLNNTLLKNFINILEYF